MHNETAASHFQNRLQLISHLYVFVGPVGVLVLCTAAEYFLGGYFSPDAKLELIAAPPRPAKPKAIPGPKAVAKKPKAEEKN